MRSTAKVIVTMGLDTLLRRLGEQGFGVSATGQVLDSTAARRLACAGDIIPVVHSKGYLATVTDQGVVWDLTPGRMSNLLPAARDAA